MTPTAQISTWIFDRCDEMLAGMDWAVEHDEPDIATRIAAGGGVVVIGAHGPCVSPARAGIEHRRATRNGTWAIGVSRVGFMVALDGRRDAGFELLDRAEAIVESVGDRVVLWMVKEYEFVLAGWERSSEHQLALIEELERLCPADGEMDMDVEAFCYDKAVNLVASSASRRLKRSSKNNACGGKERTSSLPWTYHAVMSSIAAYGGQLESALEMAIKAARGAENDRIYGPACGVLERVATWPNGSKIPRCSQRRSSVITTSK